jgi:hypothetical protein
MDGLRRSGRGWRLGGRMIWGRELVNWVFRCELEGALD